MPLRFGRPAGHSSRIRTLEAFDLLNRPIGWSHTVRRPKCLLWLTRDRPSAGSGARAASCDRSAKQGSHVKVECDCGRCRTMVPLHWGPDLTAERLRAIEPDLEPCPVRVRLDRRAQ